MEEIRDFKVFFVMTSGALERMTRFVQQGILRRILSSFVYKDLIDKLAKNLGPEHTKKMDILIDSGAFTVMTQGKVINISEYVDYLRAFTAEDRWASVYAFNLDVIPELDKFGHLSHETEEKAAEASFKNYLYLTEQAKLDFIIPVYHYRENLKWLKKIVESGCQYFAFGGMSGKVKSSAVKKKAFSELFLRLEEYGYKGKVHMLGLCMPEVLCSNAWYSVDATITKSAGYGHIYLFDEKSKNKVSVCPVSPIRGRHESVMGAHSSDSYLADQLKVIGMGDITIEEMTTSFWARVEACFRSWSMFEDFVNRRRKELGRNCVYDIGIQRDVHSFWNGFGHDDKA